MSAKKSKPEYGPWDKEPGKCNARKPDGKGRCRQPAGFGVEGMTRGPCKFHGGATKSVKQHHQKAMALEAVVTYGLPRTVNPMQALEDLLFSSAGHVAYLAAVIHNSPPDALVWGPTQEQRQHQKQRGGAASMPHGRLDVEMRTGTIEAAPSVWLKLYQEERKFLMQVAKTLIDCGHEERKVRLIERYAATMFELQEEIWTRARSAGLLAKGVDETHPGLRQIAAGCFREITTGGVDAVAEES